jgi:regulator of sigma E protease
MALLQNIWWYLVLIGVMILVHELGHYWAARFFDVKVETFSFGFGPRLFGFKHGETDFRFSLILFGGYVKMTGEQPGDSASGDGQAADPRALTSKPRWQRMIVAFAGPAINIVLAVGLLTGLFMVHFPKVPNPNSPFIGYLAPEGAAAKAGVKTGDQVVQIDDIADPTWEQIAIKSATNASRALDVWVMRGGERLHLTVTPTLEEKQGIGNAGWAQESEIEVAGVLKGMDGERAGLERGDILVSVNGQTLRSISRLNEIETETNGAPLDLVYARHGQTQHVTVKPARRDAEGPNGPRWMIGLSLQPRVEIVRLSLPAALRESTRENIQNTQLILKSIEGIIQRKMSAKSLQGPIGIAQMSGEAAREGAVSYFGLMAAVSLNLAVFNLLPIPILDGGVMLMLLVEMLLRRDLDMKVKEAVVKAGFVFLMFVVVFVIYNDISKIFPPG